NPPNHLHHTITKQNKTPATITNFDQPIPRPQPQINQPKNQPHKLINTQFATPQQLNNPFTQLKPPQPNINQPKTLLQNTPHNTQLLTPKHHLQQL
ncbi:hypothetical protein, partial [Staphylococcus capitis]|uniref:hypothetical protein n=1 Tax=Staphylococcus capitis TaxID=29388 RepID=UPI001642BCAF